MSENKFKTMRHIETVRNYLDAVIKALINRSETHDQSKLQSPEVEAFEIYTKKLRDCTYGSEQYKKFLEELKPVLKHHYNLNSHHPEHYISGVKDMTLIDIIEMFCDWQAAGLRHEDGDIFKSIEINQKRYGFSDELADIFRNTARWLLTEKVNHKAQES